MVSRPLLILPETRNAETGAIRTRISVALPVILGRIG